MKNNRKLNGAKKPPIFAAGAERASESSARKLRAENRKRGLSPVSFCVNVQRTMEW